MEVAIDTVENAEEPDIVSTVTDDGIVDLLTNVPIDQRTKSKLMETLFKIVVVVLFVHNSAQIRKSLSVAFPMLTKKREKSYDHSATNLAYGTQIAILCTSLISFVDLAFPNNRKLIITAHSFRIIMLLCMVVFSFMSIRRGHRETPFDIRFYLIVTLMLLISNTTSAGLSLIRLKKQAGHNSVYDWVNAAIAVSLDVLILIQFGRTLYRMFVLERKTAMHNHLTTFIICAGMILMSKTVLLRLVKHHAENIVGHTIDHIGPISLPN